MEKNIKTVDTISDKDLSELVRKYPFCQDLHMVNLERNTGSPAFVSLLQTASIYSIDPFMFISWFDHIASQEESSAEDTLSEGIGHLDEAPVVIEMGAETAMDPDNAITGDSEDQIHPSTSINEGHEFVESIITEEDTLSVEANEFGTENDTLVYEDTEGYYITMGKKKKKKSNLQLEEGAETSDYVRWLMKFTESTPFGKNEPARKPKKKSKKKKSKKNKSGKIQAVSQTLAEIVAKQGDTATAISMYKELSLIFPEKSSFFADRIKKLKKNK